MTQIAKYTVGVAFDLQRAEWQKLDRNLKNLEKKLSAFSRKFKLSIADFSVDQKRLNIVLKDAFRNASQTTPLRITKFIVDGPALNRAIRSAAGTAAVGGAGGYPRGVLPRDEWDRREAEKQRLWWERRNALREDAAARAAARMQSRTIGGGGGITGRHAGIAGGVGGLAARAYMPLLAVAGGGYGLAQLNNRNQQIVSAQLQTSAIVQQAGGTAAQGQESFDWLRAQGDRVGFNWLDAAGDYNKLISGLTGAGMSVGQSQGVFKGFSELARVNKLDKTAQNRLFRALSQVAGKDQLMSEELTGQIAEALPGGVALFAEAYQRKLASEGRGGGKVGAEAITELREAMKNKQVRGDILLYAGQQAEQMAAPGLSAAMRASQAEQARFQNAYNELARIASDNGVESGFARLFRALKDGAKESAPLVKSLANGFDEVTKYAAVALLTFQDIQRFFQGRDSLIGDTLFPDKESQAAAFEFIERYKGFWAEIKTLIGNAVDGWKMLFSTVNWGALLEGAGAFLSVLQNLFGALNAAISGNYAEAASRLKSAAGTALTPVTTVVNGASNLVVSGMEALDPRVGQNSQPRLVLGIPQTKSDLDYKTEQQAQLQMAAAQNAKDGFPNITGVFPMKPSETTVTVNIYDATDPQKVGAVVQQHIEDAFRSVNVDNSNQE